MKVAIKICGGNSGQGDETKPIIRRRRALQAYYGSARSDGSRLPFLLEPPAAAKILASMVSSRESVAALGNKGEIGNLVEYLLHSIRHMKPNDFIGYVCRQT
ncbi:MAG TPA: hypothetical protein VMA13_08785 [Candidatus Saccharimonadales bacterium]|nr:hypothetical protein [Candidatus Saccharimonadales bacterium]